MSLDTINSRIQHIINTMFEGNKAAFAKTIGKAPTTIANIVGRRQTAPSSDIIEGILNSIENINPYWLVTGIGDMIVANDTSQLIHEAQEEYNKRHTNSREDHTANILALEKKQGVPYYENIEATCSIISQYNDYPEAPTFFINYEHFNDCTAYLPVVGDSMYPQYCSGEIVAVKKIPNKDIIQWGEAYFVVTNDNANSLRTIKQIHYCEDESKIVLRASNPNFKGDTIIDKNDIVSLFIIKGKIKRNQL